MEVTLRKKPISAIANHACQQPGLEDIKVNEWLIWQVFSSATEHSTAV
jgi:hypothetical protein